MHNHLLLKSEQNKVAFFHLKGKVLAPCIHCIYYSCLQKIMGVLKFHYTSTYEASHKLKGKKGNTHGYYIDEFADIFYEEWDKRDSATIRKKLKDLKQFRVDADYADMEVLENKVEKAEKIMDEFHRIIKKHMRL